MPDYKGLTIKFGADDSGLTDALRRVDAAAQVTSRNLQVVTSAMRVSPNNVSLVTSAYTAASRASQSWGNHVTLLKAKQAELNERLAKTTSNMKSLEAAGHKNGVVYNSLDIMAGRYSEELETVNSELAIAEARWESSKNVTAMWNTELAVSSTNLGRVTRDVEASGELLTGFGDSLLAIGGRLTAVSALVAATFGRSAVTAAEQFGNEISRLGGYLNLSGEELDRMSDLALHWGKETIFSAGEAAEAMNELAKGGLSQAQIESGALEASLDLAAAGGIGMAQAAEVAVQAIKTFGIEAEDASTVADALAGAANKSTAEVSDLSAGFVQVGGWARLAGWDINDAAGALALLSDYGYTGSMAGTALKVMLQRIAAPTQKAKDLMEELGIEVRDASGHMKKAPEIIDEFNRATANLGEEERDAALNTIFGTRAINAILALMQAGSGTLGDYIDSTKEVGYAGEMAQARLGDLGWALELLRGEAETASVNLGKALTPMIIELARTVEGLLSKWNSLTDAERQNIAQMALHALAAGPVITAVGALTKGIGGLLLNGARAVRFMAYFSNALKTGATTAKAAGQAMTLLQKGTLEGADAGVALAANSEKAAVALRALKTGLALAALAAAAFVALKVWQEFEKQRKYAEKAEKSTHALSDAFKGIEDDSKDAADGIGILGDSLEDEKSKVEEAIDAHLEFAESVRNDMASLDSNVARWEKAQEAIEKYGDAGRELSREELGELQYALSIVNDELGTNYRYSADAKAIVNEEGEAVEGLTKKIWAQIDAIKARAKMGVVEKVLTEAYEKQYSAQQDYNDALQKETDLRRDLNTAVWDYTKALSDAELDGVISSDESKKLQDLHQDMNDLEADYIAAAEETARYNGVLQDTNRTVDAAEEKYADLAKELDSANKEVNKHAESISELVAQYDSVNVMFEDSTAIENFQQWLTDGGISVEQFAQLTEDQMARVVEAWQTEGRLSRDEVNLLTGAYDNLSATTVEKMQAVADVTKLSMSDVAAAIAQGMNEGVLDTSSSVDEIKGYIDSLNEVSASPTIGAETESADKKIQQVGSDLDDLDGTSRTVSIQSTYDSTGEDQALAGIGNIAGKSIPPKLIEFIANLFGLQQAENAIGGYERRPIHEKTAKIGSDTSGITTAYNALNGYNNRAWIKDLTSTFYANDGPVWAAVNNFNYNARLNNLTSHFSANASGGYLPRHADGFIATGPTLTNVGLIGEAGAEAYTGNTLVPLTNTRYSKPFVDLIVSGIRKGVGSGGTTYNVSFDGVRVNDDPEIKQAFVDLMYVVGKRGGMNLG